MSDTLTTRIEQLKTLNLTDAEIKGICGRLSAAHPERVAEQVCIPLCYADRAFLTHVEFDMCRLIGSLTRERMVLGEAVAENERLREILREVLAHQPWPFHHGEPDTGQYDAWFAALKETRGLIEEKA